MATKKDSSTKTTPMHSLQRSPSKQEREAMQRNPKKYCAEAIAMRRIIVEEGRWLSPFMADAPLPVLTEWERTVDLTKLEPLRNYDPITGRLVDHRRAG
jgi:hypothetical protein